MKPPPPAPGDSDPALRALLARWHVRETPSQDFERRVWNRIERETVLVQRAPHDRSDATSGPGLLSRVLALLSRGGGAVQYAGVTPWVLAFLCVGTGAGLGAWQARRDAPRHYVAMLTTALHPAKSSPGIPAAWLSDSPGEPPGGSSNTPRSQ
jgi:hypothetical protein